MSLKIRLSRGGSKKDAHYKIVVLENTKSRDGKATDIIGHYHPNVEEAEKRFVIEAGKLDKWLSFGALPTETLARLCVRSGIKSMEKYIPVHGESKNKGIKKKDRKKDSK